jgi:glycosyltransferase involved in cell wall biosynthesis
MKIILLNNYHYKFGGASAVYLNTANLLEKMGHQVVFFSLLDNNNIATDSQRYFIEKKVDAKGSVLNKALNFKQYFSNKQSAERIEELIVNEKPDIAHIHLFIGGLTPSILPVLKKYKIPVVYTAHDYRLVCPAYTFLNGDGEICEECRGKEFYHCIKNKCAKNSTIDSTIMSLEMYYRNIYYNPGKFIDGFIYVSNFAKEKHIEYFQSLKTKKSIVLYNFTTGIKNTKTKKKYFLFFGRLSHEKGLNTLISAFSKLKSCELIIAGDGPEMKKIELTLNKNEISNIKCIGFVQGETLTELIANAYFVVVPSEWYENNPMTIVEAYRFGTPVIGANIGGIPEIINEGETGFLFESRDVESLTNAIQKAKSLSDSDYLKMCSNAINFSFENFNEEVHYKKLIDFYSEVIKSY